MSAIEAVLFDFDGTLWDCEPLIFQAYDECFQWYGQRLPHAVWLRMMGTANVSPWRCLEELSGGPIDHAAAELLVRRRKQDLLATAQARAGVRCLLDEVDGRGLPRAIVSNSDRSWIARYARQCGIVDGWSFVECADGDARRAKPAPDLYLAALARLGLDAERVVAIEDSPTGVRAAKLAGLPCVAITTRTTAPLLDEADVRIDSFERHDLWSLLDAATPAQRTPSP